VGDCGKRGSKLRRGEEKGDLIPCFGGETDWTATHRGKRTKHTRGLGGGGVIKKKRFPGFDKKRKRKKKKKCFHGEKPHHRGMVKNLEWITLPIVFEKS